VTAAALRLARWLLRCVATVLLVSVLSFLMADALPGDMAYRVAAARYDADRVDAGVTERVRQELGLDQPLSIRLQRWLIEIARGDLGRSVVTGVAVRDELAAPLIRSLLLVGSAWPLVVAVGVSLGLALGRSSRGVALAQAAGAIAAGTPSYVLGLALGLIFAIRLGWLPVAGYGSAAYLVLPAATLVLLGSLRLALVTARAAFSAGQHPSIGFARMKGLPDNEIAFLHVLPLAAPIVVAYAFVSLAFLLEGAAVIETVFAYPGIGRRLVDAVQARDVPVIQGAGIAIALLVTTANSVADAVAAGIGGVR
jgi:peptide/nickel transport system permease protein